MDPFIGLLSEHGHRYYPIQQILYELLDIQNIINLTRTSKKLESLYRHLVPLQWNLEKRLQRFVKKPRDFRLKLGISDGLISGTFALQFFERAVSSNSVLGCCLAFISGFDVSEDEGSKTPSSSQEHVTSNIRAARLIDLPSFQPPDSWQHLDHLIPSFVEQYVALQRGRRGVKADLLEKQAMGDTVGAVMSKPRLEECESELERVAREAERACRSIRQQRGRQR